MQRGNLHGGCEYDDSQSLLDMTPHKNPKSGRINYFVTFRNDSCISNKILSQEIKKGISQFVSKQMSSYIICNESYRINTHMDDHEGSFTHSCTPDLEQDDSTMHHGAVHI